MTRHELNIGAGTLDRPIENVVATMQHEMVHLWNIQQGVQDYSRGGQYHNKRFKQAAEERDLLISYDPRVGWSVTEPGYGLIEFILEQDWGEIKMSRLEGWQATGLGGRGPAATGKTINPPKGNSRKLQCPCCGVSVRATRDGLRLLCMDCGEQMQYV